MKPVKVSKGAKIRNRYNQVPHLTQDTNGKVTCPNVALKLCKYQVYVSNFITKSNSLSHNLNIRSLSRQLSQTNHTIML